LLITASQWTVSGQNEYLSRQNFGMAVILTGQVPHFQIIINTTGHHSKIILSPVTYVIVAYHKLVTFLVKLAPFQSYMYIAIGQLWQKIYCRH